MKLFLIKILIFLAAIVLAAYPLDYLISTGLSSSGYEVYPKWRDILDGNINADLLVQGSSRAWVMVSTNVLDSALKTNSYNIGINGYQFFMHKKKYDIYRQFNKKPKVIIQILDIFTFKKRIDLYNYSQFLPFMKVRQLAELTNDYEGFNWSDYNIPLVRYYGKWKLGLIGISEYFGLYHYKNSNHKGYFAKDVEWDFTFDKFIKESPKGVPQPILENVLELFDHFLDQCNKENINLVLVYPPELKIAQKYCTNRDKIFEKFTYFSNKHSIKFIDYSDDPISYDKSLFYNSQHLNKTGTEIFTKKLADTLKQLDIFRNN